MDIEILEAIKALDEGKLVCFPSETVYALAADATNDDAVKAVYALKGRGEHTPLSLMVADIAMAKGYVIWNEKAERLATAFWPGPLTLILPMRRDSSKHIISHYVNESTSTLGIRISNHPVAQKILTTFGKPIVATSANPSGKPSAVSAEEIAHYFGDQVCIVQGKKGHSGIASTVVDMTCNPPAILREGTISQKQIEMLLHTHDR
jgi:L-threonylcarbamoyladenylate synthase